MDSLSGVNMHDTFACWIGEGILDCQGSFVTQVSMKYQDFSSDENFVSSEDTIGKISRLSWLLQSQPIGNYHHSIARVYFFIHESVALKNKMQFTNHLPNFDINIFDDEQNERIDGRFVPVTDGEADNLIETEENANTKNKRLVQEIVVLVFHWCLCYKQQCSLRDINLNIRR